MFLDAQNSWQAQHFDLHAPLEALAVALSAVVWWSPVRPSIVIRVFTFLDVQNSWQAQHFVNLHAPLEALAVALSAVVCGGRRSVPPL